MSKRRVMVTTALVFCLCFMSFLIAMAQQEEAAATAEQGVENVFKVSQEESVPAIVPSVEPTVEPTVEPIAEPAVQEAPKEEAVVKTAEASTQWLWGEVVSIDQEKKELVVKHMDYETYEDVNTTIKSDENTMFENIENLSEIKAGDRVTLDYKVKDGSNMAELVVVEKGEPAATTQTPSLPVAEVNTTPTAAPSTPVVEESAASQASEATPQAAPTTEPQKPLEMPKEQTSQ